MYKRKTKDEFRVMGYYTRGHGWEEVTCADSMREAVGLLGDYAINEPQYRHKIIIKRVKI